MCWDKIKVLCIQLATTQLYLDLFTHHLDALSPLVGFEVQTIDCFICTLSIML